ncbi:hypothetical protein BDW71DRAFT_190691 [Aspergillus fruticulosus]
MLGSYSFGAPPPAITNLFAVQLTWFLDLAPAERWICIPRAPVACATPAPALFMHRLLQILVSRQACVSESRSRA